MIFRDVATATPEAFALMHEGAAALADVESHGIRIDVDQLEASTLDTQDRIRELKDKMRASDVYKLWLRRYGEKTRLNSRQQLAVILFEEMGYESDAKTAKGNVKVNETVLEKIDLEFVRWFLEWQKLEKLSGTYLNGIKNEVCNGYLHPVFNLHLVATYRSSSDSPNFQNVPIRNPSVAKVIRSIFVPRPGHVLVEVDYSGIEVRIAACYHKDAVMLDYIKTGYDMHFDMAKELFFLSDEQVTKAARQMAKNLFVFSEFYGNWFAAVARDIWDQIDRFKLEVDGVPMKDHLANEGIESRGDCVGDPAHGTYEKYVQQVEHRFWYERFDKYRRWREYWWAKYQDNGWFRTKTGFVIQGVYKRNEVLNSPIQGSAFHCLLWSLIRVHKWLRRNGMRSMIVGQIHDSLILDCHLKELDDVLHKVKKIMCVDLLEAWPWIITPLDIEAEVGEKNWYEKKQISV